MIKLYTKDNCPRCVLLKELLDDRGVSYECIDVDQDADARTFLIDSGLRSVPQLYTGDILIPGGYDGIKIKPVAFFEQLSSGATIDEVSETINS